MTAYRLPIAVEATMVIVKAAAAIVTPIGNPEHAIHGAHGSADAGSDRAANQSAHRTGGPVAFIRTFLGAAHDALRVPDMGNRQQAESECSTRKIESDRRTGRQRRCLDLRRRFHLDSS